MSWDERKREELLAKLSAIERELTFWQAQSKEKAPLEKHQSQIQRLVNQLQPVISRVGGDISTAYLRGYWPTLEMQVLDLHRIWQFFREKLTLRFVDHFREYLIAADEFAWECYRPAQESLVAARTLDSSEIKEPPLVCFSSVATPFSIPRGVSYLGELQGGSPRDRATRVMVESLPIPVVAVPWYQIQHLPDALVLGHEVGHVVERDARIREPVRQLMLNAVRDTDKCYGTQDDWQRWSSEVFADIYGALCGGPAFASALADFLLVPAGHSSGGAGEYPPTNVRLALVMAALRGAGANAPGTTAEDGEDLRALEERWMQEGVELHQAKEAPAVASAVVGSRYAQFGNLRLADVASFNRRQMRITAHALLDGDPVEARNVRTLIAAAAWAYAENPRKYHLDNVPGRVLRRVMCIVEPGVRQARVIPAGERATADAQAAMKLYDLLVQASVA